MRISVIIPVYNAHHYLKELFKCLDSNAFHDGDEILLVDNGSTDGSFEVCKEKEKKNPSIYQALQYKDKAGSYSARNYAVKNASGDVFVFTDSDTKPDASWISTIRDRISHKHIIAGSIQLDIINNGLWEHFDTIAHLNSEDNAECNSVATANMAVFKDDFFEIGLFEERFSGGDYEWSQRAVKNGMKIIYVPEAIVHHPTRKTFEQILGKERRIAYGTGNHYKSTGKSILMLRLRFLLKMIKFDTNLKYIKALKERGFKKEQLRYFNKCFMKIRKEQYIHAVKGYKMLDVRQLGLK